MSWNLITAEALFTGLLVEGITCLWQPWPVQVAFFTQCLATQTKGSSRAVGSPIEMESASRSSILSRLSLFRTKKRFVIRGNKLDATSRPGLSMRGKDEAAGGPGKPPACLSLALT